MRPNTENRRPSVSAVFLLAVVLLAPQPGLGSERDVRNSVALGALAFADNCSKCHQVDGYGEEALYPSLHDPQLLANKDLLVTTVLDGRMGHMEDNGEGAQRLMPAMGFLSNREIADIIAFISNSWGNEVLIVTPQEVQRARGGSGSKDTAR
ncbi:MAG: cytochrome c [Halioglobus sp.]|nr:cytochrome c [Halioglobus sp.]